MQLSGWVYEKFTNSFLQQVFISQFILQNVIFFNAFRHGIDLDNPGAPGTQSQLIAAAAQQGFSPVDGALSSLNQLGSNLSVSVTSGASANYSDSGDSNGNRSADNATPPMHFLTPHVEISMADAPASVYSPSTVSNILSNSL